MKKKLLSLILAAVMAGSLVGCGSKAPAAAASSEAGSAEAPATGAADTAESAKALRQREIRRNGPQLRYRCLY